MLEFITTEYMIVSVIACVLICLYHGVPFWMSAILCLGIMVMGQVDPIVLASCGVVVVLLALAFFRRMVFTFPIYCAMKWLKFLPAVSATEKEAIEAGSTWVDKTLFSGNPSFKALLSTPYAQLSDEEVAYIEGPVTTLCNKVVDWDVYQQRDFSDDVWDFMKKERLFGLIIPKEYGGLGFSAAANSAIVAKVSSRSTPLGITVMVPNSLGPAELLTHYGTKEQKEHYLPRLAVGEEIPCFALTEPAAGSDAGAMTSSGVVFMGSDGKPWLRLNWNKRYITLAAKATLLGLAFKCTDPDNILGKGIDRGITCALIPAGKPGVVIGERHDPLGVPFYNCPTEGHDVEVPIDAVIGGASCVGMGWKMLMECLSAGRGISLPANCTGGAALVSRVVGAYSMIRKQFGLEIGKFTGIQEPVAEIAGLTYLLGAAKEYTCGGLDAGEKPAVVTAIMKYHSTELFRKIINHGMDVCGGAGISLGPRNLLGHPYIAAPIGVTVEGANILTRSLMIFGQGAIRCHPYALEEIYALESHDLVRFDKAFWKHIGHVATNGLKTLVYELTRGIFILPDRWDRHFRTYQRLTWVSAKFAFYADVAMILFGGGLKLRERLTARLGDILSWMYLATTVLKRYQEEGAQKEDAVLVEWAIAYALSAINTAFIGLFQNMGPLFKPLQWLSCLNPVGLYPSDALSSAVAATIQRPTKQRDRITAGIHLPAQSSDSLAMLDRALDMISTAEPGYKLLKKAMKSGKLPKAPVKDVIEKAVALAILTSEQARLILAAEAMTEEVVAVDQFSQESYMKTAVHKIKT